MKNIHFITAGAGSGKTFSLTKELVNKIQKDGVKPSEVILTTFTKAAASEFKQKASSALLKASMEIESLQLAGAKIGTIDSICQSFVQKYWYLLGISPELNVIADTEVKFFENQSLESLVTQNDLELFEEARKAFKISKKENSITKDDPDFWRTHLKGIINQSRNYGIVDYSDSVSKSNNLIDRIFCKEDSVDWNYVNAFLDGDAKQVLKKINGQWTKTESTKSKDIDGLKYYHNTYYLLKQSVKILSDYQDGKNIEGLCDMASVKGNSVIILSSWQKYIDYCTARLQSKEFGVKMKEYVKRIFEIASKWSTKYDEYKKEHRLIDYNDMENLFLELLSKEIVVNDLRSDYKVIMVDEYQDCNPLQVEIFNRLSDIIGSRTYGEGQSIWVGDKKQSIYGFRGSDMALINAVADKFSAETDNLTTDSLKNSFRSRKKLVDASNDIFADKIFNDASSRLNPSRVINGEDDMPATAALVDWTFEAKNVSDYYMSLAWKIKKILDGDDSDIKKVVEYEFGNDGYHQKGKHNVCAGDIAILTRTNNKVPEIVNALNAFGINVNVIEQNLKDYVEIQLILAVLGYCIQKTEYDKARILYLYDGKTTESIISEKLSGDLIDKNGIIAKIDNIIEHTKGQSLSQLVETIIIELDIWNMVGKWGMETRRHAHISTFRQVVAGYEEHTRLLGLAPSVMGFLNYFDMDGVIPETTFIKEENAVSVITYHKSKGLEWPVVILDSLNDDSLFEGKLIDRNLFGVQHAPMEGSEIERKKRNEYITLLLNIDAGGSIPDVILENIRSLVEKDSVIYNKVKDEQSRLLYVGFTRAKDYLVTTSYQHGEAYRWLNDLGIYDEKSVWPGQNITKIDAIAVPSVVEQTTTTYNRIVVSKKEEKSTVAKYITPSTLGMKTLKKEVVVSTPENLGHPFNLKLEDESMSLVGTCIHDIFASFDNNLSKPSQIERAKSILELHGFTTLIEHSEHIVDAILALYQYLEKTYGQASAILHELPILYRNDDGQILNGSIDLIWKTEKGCVVVDFKNKKNNEEAADSARGYTPQLYAYYEALQKAGETVADMILFYPIQSLLIKLGVSE